MSIPWHTSGEVAAALRERRPVVALESTLIAHGLPYPLNLQTAQEAEAAVRADGAVPATVAILDGSIRIGLTTTELERLATEKHVLKASRRDLGIAVGLKQTAATTVAATMFLAHRIGIQVFATGGIGGVHRGAHETFDISADLVELARTPVCVVCAGAKSILDIPKTLEVLETHGVPVLGFGLHEFPAFYVTSSGQRVEARVDSPAEVVAILKSHWELGGAGVVLAQPPPAELALPADVFQEALAWAEEAALTQNIRGKALTPFLLAQVAERTGGRTLEVNRALIVANARLAGRVAVELCRSAVEQTSHAPRIDR
jgi:pseudouridine-5'-phosphate glycosidase